MSTAIIDLDSLCYAIGAGKKIEIDKDEQGNPIYQRDELGRLVYEEKSAEELILSADFMMREILTKSKASSYVAYIKGNNTIDYRLKFNPEYKQDRNKEAPVWWNFVKTYLIKEWGAIQVDNMEVDDLVISSKSIPNSFICAIDSDILGTEGTHYNWKKDTWITVTKEEETHKFWTEMITGGHNNTKGIEGLGAVKAANILKDVTDYPPVVLRAYIHRYGEEGIDLFYKNYKSLKPIIVDVDVEPIKFKNPIEENINIDII